MNGWCRQSAGHRRSSAFRYRQTCSKRLGDRDIHNGRQSRIRINEDEVCYLGKLEFVGNSFTKDHVIRREWLLREGRRLNMQALEDSIRRMKQLGLVTIEKMPEIEPDPQNPNKINIKALITNVIE